MHTSTKPTDFAEVPAVMAGVLATPMQKSSFAAGHNCLYNFPRNLAPDFTHYLSERPNKTKNKTEDYETKNVVRRASFSQRPVTPRTE